jgi:hypothetical protein
METKPHQQVADLNSLAKTSSNSARQLKLNPGV